MENSTPKPAAAAPEANSVTTVSVPQEQLQQLYAERDNAILTSKVLEESFGEERRRGDQIIIDMGRLKVQMQLNQQNFQRDVKALQEENLKLKTEIADLRKPREIPPEVSRLMPAQVEPARPQLVHPPAPPAADAPAAEPEAPPAPAEPGTEKPS